ncbi:MULTISPECIES: riboflavin biosynthesis protein RibA [Cupriavidus]|uniref:riboflavin biosynthesis protein RibA n=1 Tax=Cupriavidus taiwanensis TaxID=164546 RepID=UPI001574E9F9|nr:riboflavin biosynthesis protein RibA [Cupriavidus taiwanensis]NSX15492.1 riboflavin biosynthesis protein RibA [Cupriavidus taiwanensis]
MTDNPLNAEAASTRIAALFDTKLAASNAAERVCYEAHLKRGQVRLVHPYEAHFGRKLEPENDGIVHTAVRSHLIMAALGAVVGLAVVGILHRQEVDAVMQSPGLAAGAALFLGVMFGMLLAGLMTARPDHQLVITPVREAVQHGRWAVLVHPTTPQQCNEALRALRNTTAEVLRTA